MKHWNNSSLFTQFMGEDWREQTHEKEDGKTKKRDTGRLLFLPPFPPKKENLYSAFLGCVISVREA